MIVPVNLVEDSLLDRSDHRIPVGGVCIDANYQDMINYSVFALIKHNEETGK